MSRDKIDGNAVIQIARRNPHITIIEPTTMPYSPPNGRKRGSPEHDEQVKLFQWAEQNLDRWDGVLWDMFSIPNAGKRSKRVGAYMVAEGLKAGIPDLFLPVPVGTYPGLFIEMKVNGNRPSAEQVKRIGRLRLRGYRVVVAYSASEAQGWIELYLDGKLPLDK